MAGIEGPRRVMPQGRPSIGVDQGRRNVLRVLFFTGAAALAAPLGSILHGCGEGGGVQGTRICDIQEIIDQRLNSSLMNELNVRFANGSLSFFVQRDLRIPEGITGFANEISQGARLTIKTGFDNGAIGMDAQRKYCLEDCSLEPVTRPYEGQAGIVIIGVGQRNFEGYLMLKEAQIPDHQVVYRPMVDRKWAQSVQYGLVGANHEINEEGEMVYRDGGELKRFTMRQEYREDGTLVYRYYEVAEDAKVVSTEWLLEEDAANGLMDRDGRFVFGVAGGNPIRTGSQLPTYYALYESKEEGTDYADKENVLLEYGEMSIPIPDTSLNGKDYQLILDPNRPLGMIMDELGGEEAVRGRALPARAVITFEDLYSVDRRENMVVDQEMGEVGSAAAVDLTGFTHGPEFTLRAIAEIKLTQDLLEALQRPVPELAWGGVIKFDLELVPAEGEAACPPRVETDAETDARTDVLADAATDAIADVPIDSVTDGGTE